MQSATLVSVQVSKDPAPSAHCCTGSWEDLNICKENSFNAETDSFAVQVNHSGHLASPRHSAIVGAANELRARPKQPLQPLLPPMPSLGQSDLIMGKDSAQANQGTFGGNTSPSSGAGAPFSVAKSLFSGEDVHCCGMSSTGSNSTNNLTGRTTTAATTHNESISASSARTNTTAAAFAASLTGSMTPAKSVDADTSDDHGATTPNGFGLSSVLTDDSTRRDGTQADANEDSVKKLSPLSQQTQPAMYGVIVTGSMANTAALASADEAVSLRSKVKATMVSDGGHDERVAPNVVCKQPTTNLTLPPGSPSAVTGSSMLATRPVRRAVVAGSAACPPTPCVPSASAVAARAAAVPAAKKKDAADNNTCALSPLVMRPPTRFTRSPPSAASPSPTVTVTFVSSRALLRDLVQSWRNRYEENKSAYKEGGYLTVVPGKLLQSRYVMIQKLGWGEFSTVWLAYDTKHSTLGRGPSQAFVAVKIAKCLACVRDSSLYETGLLMYLNALVPADSPVTNLIDSFEVRGEYGTHLCMVMPVHGSNLLSIIDQLKAKKTVRTPEEVVLIKEVLLSTLEGLRQLHAVNIIHTDIKPENVLCTSPDPRIMSTMETFCQKNSHRSSVISADVLRAHVLGAHSFSAASCGSSSSPLGTSESSSSNGASTCDDSSSAGSPTSNAALCGPAAATPTPPPAASVHLQHLVCLADFGLSAALEPPASPTGDSAPLEPFANLSDLPTHTGPAMSGSERKDLLGRLAQSKREFCVKESGKLRNRSGVLIQTREYRAPEVLLGLDFTCATDMWSVGCMAYELITGDFLVDPKKHYQHLNRLLPTNTSMSNRPSNSERLMDIEHIAMIQQLIGPFPQWVSAKRTDFNAYYDMRRSNPRATQFTAVRSHRPPAYIHRYIDEDGKFIYNDYYFGAGTCNGVYSRRYPQHRVLADELRPFLPESEAHQAAAFILHCLGGYNPQDRPSAAEAMQHRWLQGIGKAM